MKSAIRNSAENPLGFNSMEDQQEKMNLNEPINEGKEKEAPTKADFAVELVDILPLVTGFLSSLRSKKEEVEKTVTTTNADYSVDESTREVSFTFNFGDVRVHTTK